MDWSKAKCYSFDRDLYPCPHGHIPHALTNWANSPPRYIQDILRMGLNIFIDLVFRMRGDGWYHTTVFYCTLLQGCCTLKLHWTHNVTASRYQLQYDLRSCLTIKPIIKKSNWGCFCIIHLSRAVNIISDRSQLGSFIILLKIIYVNKQIPISIPCG